MGQPQAYKRSKNFVENAGAATDHSAINAELDNVALSINQLRANIALIQNDAGNPRGLSVPGAGLVVAEVANGKQGVVTLAAQLAAPVQSAPATATAGGTLAAATYYYVVTALNANGQTLKSNEQSIITTGTTSTNTVNWGAVTGATAYRIYRGTATGVYGGYIEVGAVTTFADTGAALTAGSPPAANNTAGALVANTSVTANSRIFLTAQQDGGTPGFLRVSERAAGASFRIISSSTADTSVVAYEIFEPAA
jgi:hypothetical protein